MNYILIFLFIFLFGLIIGSFLNVVIFRLNTGLSISRGRSKCMVCNHKLSWYELIPVISYLSLLGKCRKCKAKISKQYLIVELLTGVIFVLIALHFLQAIFISPLIFVFLFTIFAFIFSLLIVIGVYDIRHKIIPNNLVYIFIGLSFLLTFVNYQTAFPLFHLPSIWNLLAGPIIALPFALIFFLSRGKWMGFGDVKLMVGIGFMLGLYLGISAIILSFWIGAFVSVLLMILSKNKIGMKSEVPFGPFLILGTLISFLFSLDVFYLFSNF